MAKYEVCKPRHSASLSLWAENWEDNQETQKEMNLQMLKYVRTLTDIIKSQWPCQSPMYLDANLIANTIVDEGKACQKTY